MDEQTAETITAGEDPREVVGRQMDVRRAIAGLTEDQRELYELFLVEAEHYDFAGQSVIVTAISFPRYVEEVSVLAHMNTTYNVSFAPRSRFSYPGDTWQVHQMEEGDAILFKVPCLVEEGTPEEVEWIEGPQEVLAFMATGIEILGRRRLPPVAETDKPELLDALEKRLGAAKKIASVKARAETLKEALELLRRVKGPRSVEFALCTKQGSWLVFSKEGQRPFTSGYAVKQATGDIYAY